MGAGLLSSPNATDVPKKMQVLGEQNLKKIGWRIGKQSSCSYRFSIFLGLHKLPNTNKYIYKNVAEGQEGLLEYENVAAAPEPKLNKKVVTTKGSQNNRKKKTFEIDLELKQLLKIQSAVEGLSIKYKRECDSLKIYSFFYGHTERFNIHFPFGFFILLDLIIFYLSACNAQADKL